MLKIWAEKTTSRSENIGNRRITPSCPIKPTWKCLKFVTEKPRDPIWKLPTHLDLKILAPKTTRSAWKPPVSAHHSPTYLDLQKRLRVRKRPFKRWRAGKHGSKQFAPDYTLLKWAFQKHLDLRFKEVFHIILSVLRNNPAPNKSTVP